MVNNVTYASAVSNAKLDHLNLQNSASKQQPANL